MTTETCEYTDHKCVICFEEFVSKSQLNVHLYSHIDRKPFTCTLCSHIFFEHSQLIKHITEIHNQVEDVPLEDENTDTFLIKPEKTKEIITEDSNEHLEELDGNSLSQCVVCYMEYPSKVELMEHLKKHISPKSFDCRSCLKSLSSENEFIKHTNFCEKLNSEKNLRKTDEDNEHIGKSKSKKMKQFTLLKCPNCPLTFNNKCHLRIHMRKYTGEKPHVCNVCQRCFASKTNLYKHLRVHTGEKKYTCQFCQKSFAYGFALRVHWRIHTGEKPYQCSICKKEFAYRKYFNAHKKAHKTGKEECTKNRDSHLSPGTIHTCNICIKQFKKKSDFTAHMVKHSGIKPFICDICGKEFARKGECKRHTDLHLGIKYNCDYCEKEFTRKNRLNEHVKKVH